MLGTAILNKPASSPSRQMGSVLRWGRADRIEQTLGPITDCRAVVQSRSGGTPPFALFPGMGPHGGTPRLCHEGSRSGLCGAKGGGGRTTLMTGSIMERFPSRSTRYDTFTITPNGGGNRPSGDARGAWDVCIGGNGHGVPLGGMITCENGGAQTDAPLLSRAMMGIQLSHEGAAMVGADRLNLPSIHKFRNQSRPFAQPSTHMCPLLGWGASLSTYIPKKMPFAGAQYMYTCSPPKGAC